jgi:integrase
MSTIESHIKFNSVFATLIYDYINLRVLSERNIRMDTSVLARLDRFLIEANLTSKELSEKLITDWIATFKVKPISKKRMITVYRCFAKYLLSLGIYAFIPDIPRSSCDYIPYLYPEDEIEKIISTADNFKLHSGLLHRIQLIGLMPLLIRVLVGCGLRLGEALSLQWSDVNLDERTLFIRYAKNNKQRLVPMHESLNDIFAMYRQSGLCQAGDKDYIFGNENGIKFSREAIRSHFRKILKQAGIKYIRPENSARGACIHCLRHVFVLRSFSKAISEGQLFDNYVPFLSTYLGHHSVRETDKYFKFSSELFPNSYESFNQYTKGMFPKGVFEE